MIEFNYLKYKKTNFDIDKAKKIYKQLCKHAKNREWQNDLYGEMHHIKPRSLGGSDSKRNLVKLTFPEHCFAHYLLAIIYSKSSMSFAFHMMIYLRPNTRKKFISQREIFESFKYFEQLRIDFVNMLRKGNVIYNFSESELDKLKQKTLELLKDNNKKEYTMREIVKKLKLPNKYVFVANIFNPLVEQGKLYKHAFHFGKLLHMMEKISKY